MKISIILPCYNEEKNIFRIEPELIFEIKKISKDYEIVCIDDGSKDNTYQELLKLKNKHKEIVIIKHETNKGLGAAVRTGIKGVTGDVTITLDADFTFHPKQIKSLLDTLKTNDVDCVIGSPTLAGYDKEVPKYRIFLSKSVNLIYNILLWKKITAVSPIFRVYKTKDLKEIQSKLTCTGFDINAEILFWLLSKNKKVIEIPATLTKRIYGESKLNNIKEIKNHIKLILKILKWKFINFFIQ